MAIVFYVYKLNANSPVWESDYMKLDILKKYALNRNDILVYEALLSLGRSKTGPIIRQTHISSSRVYESLQNLLQKSLVSYNVKNNIKYYLAESLDILLTTAKEDADRLEQLSKEIGLFPTGPIGRNETNVYEGKHGFRMAFNQHVESFESKETVSIVAFSERSGQKRELRSFLSSIEKIMSQKNCRSQILRDKKSKEKISRIQMSKIHETRFLPSGYFSPTAINISKKEVLISIWSDNPIVFSIRNPIVVDSFKRNFEFLWESAKK